MLYGRNDYQAPSVAAPSETSVYNIRRERLPSNLSRSFLVRSIYGIWQERLLSKDSVAASLGLSSPIYGKDGLSAVKVVWTAPETGRAVGGGGGCIILFCLGQ